MGSSSSISICELVFRSGRSDLMPSPRYLFVYGTLLRDRTPSEMAGVMRSLEFVSEGSASGRVLDLGSYPGALFDRKSTSNVHGEIYKLPANSDALRKLDVYEEFRPRYPRQSLFIRESVPVQTTDGKKLNCWAYRFNTDRLKKRAPRKQAVRASRATSRRATR